MADRIESVQQEGRRFPPSEAFRKGARVSSGAEDEGDGGDEDGGRDAVLVAHGLGHLLVAAGGRLVLGHALLHHVVAAIPITIVRRA